MTNNSRARYYQLVLLGVTDAEKFARYMALMRPVALRYGGALERMLKPEQIYSDALPKPEIANIVTYDDKEAFHSFNVDPDFLAIKHLRSESLEMSAVNGQAIGGALEPGELAQRRYLVEIAHYQDGVAGYHRYESEASGLTSRYGYHVERLLAPDVAHGLPFQPNVVKIAYFDTPDGLDLMQRDPEHERLDKLYGSAVSQSIWLLGRVHPSTLQPGAPSPRSEPTR